MSTTNYGILTDHNGSLDHVSSSEPLVQFPYTLIRVFLSLHRSLIPLLPYLISFSVPSVRNLRNLSLYNPLSFV